MDTNTILVSAFLTNINERHNQDINNHVKIVKYIENGKKILTAPINKIIFIDKSLMDEFKDYQNEYTSLIPITKEDLYLNSYKNKITQFSLNTTYPEKDSLDYMLLMCNKTEFMRKAIETDPFTPLCVSDNKNTQFIWLDFGINYICKCSDEEFIQKIMKLSNNCDSEKVRLGSIILWDPNIAYSYNIYKDIVWYFTGGILGGNKESLVKFADLVKEKCIETITTHKTIMWEINIWYLVYKDHPELFSYYKCDHNDSLIDNY